MSIATIEAMNQNVGQFVSEHAAVSAPVERDIETLARVLDSIDAVPSHLMKRDADKRDAAMKAVTHFMSQRLAEKYPLVSPELLERKRWIQLEVRKGRPWTITGESLSKPEEVDTSEKDELGVVHRLWTSMPLLLMSKRNATLATSLTGYGSYHITAKTPEAPEKAKECERLATAVVMDIAAELLRFERTSHIAYQMFRERYSNGIKTPDYHIAWVPLLDELRLEVRPPDPALLLDFHGYTHLVTHWDAPGERPIEAILREYTSGTFPASLDELDE